jgi:hypothetical protein
VATGDWPAGDYQVGLSSFGLRLRPLSQRQRLRDPVSLPVLDMSVERTMLGSPLQNKPLEVPFFG